MLLKRTQKKLPRNSHKRIKIALPPARTWPARAFYIYPPATSPLADADPEIMVSDASDKNRHQKVGSRCRKEEGEDQACSEGHQASGDGRLVDAFFAPLPCASPLEISVERGVRFSSKADPEEFGEADSTECLSQVVLCRDRVRISMLGFCQLGLVHVVLGHTTSSATVDRAGCKVGDRGVRYGEYRVRRWYCEHAVPLISASGCILDEGFVKESCCLNVFADATAIIVLCAHCRIEHTCNQRYAPRHVTNVS